MHLRLILLLFTLLALQNVQAKQKKIKTGVWYGAFELSENDNLPFLFEIEKVNKKPVLYIINGNERILLNDIKVSGDSLFIQFPAFASEFRVEVKNKKTISGRWYNHAKKGNYYLPFKGEYGKKERYPKSIANFEASGKWEVTFDYKTEPGKAIGIFSSAVSSMKASGYDSNKITGTFLTETGDYRFLEGAAINDSLYLSTFDGSHAFLFSARFLNDTLWGEFRSGSHYKTEWFAIKNENAKIGNPDSLTYLVNEEPVQFSLPDINGGNYVYPNTETEGKVTLIQIMGTWCPNCLDESNYLKTLKTQHGDMLEIIAVTFETQKSLEDRIEKVKTYKANLGLDYEFVVGGTACKSCATEMFPMLNEIISFPTVIFIDKNGVIRKIHTGFNGPGTGEYYSNFVQNTDSFVKQLVNE
ncbi:MAG: thiol-disulfide isomerase/thioredoxin [Arenicella sp.]|jgi:thiol-disulfide isomerase/thioredoxin